MAAPKDSQRDAGGPRPLKVRSFRVEDGLWRDALAAARRQDTTRTQVLVDALVALVARDRAQRAFVEGLAPEGRDDDYSDAGVDELELGLEAGR